MKDEYNPAQRKKQEQRMQKLTNKRLVHLSLRKWQSIKSSSAIAELSTRCTPETVELVQRLFLSERWKRRALAIHIISELRNVMDDENNFAEMNGTVKEHF